MKPIAHYESCTCCCARRDFTNGTIHIHCRVWTERTSRFAGWRRNLKGLEIQVERGGLVAPKISEVPLPDAKGELQALARELQRAGIHTLIFAREFHVGELDTLAQLVKTTLLTSEEA